MRLKKPQKYFLNVYFSHHIVIYYLPSLENQTKLELADIGPGEYV